jgi:hypothetical protein
MLAAVVGCVKWWSVESNCHQQSSTVSNQTAQKRLQLQLQLCHQRNLTDADRLAHPRASILVRSPVSRSDMQISEKKWLL